MTSSPSRLRRAFAVLSLMLSLVVVTSSMAFTAPPAYADASDIGGGTGGGSGSGGGQNGGGLPYCTSGGYGGFNGDNQQFIPPFPGCRSGMNWTTGLEQCTTGFEVWRFYGPRSNPTRYTTVSKANMPDWCQTNRTYRYFLPHPNDAGARVAGPWAARAMRNNYGEGVTFSEVGITGCRETAQGGSCLTTTEAPFRYLANGQDDRSQSCNNLRSSRDPLAEYFTGAAMDRNQPEEYNAGLSVRKSLLDIFTGWNTTFGKGVALSAINAKGPNAPNPNRNGNDIKYNDGIPCSSSLDFAQSSSTADPLVFGSCVVPVTRVGRVYTGSGAREHAFWNPSTSPKMGPRYGLEYADEAASQRANGANPAWRRAIRAEINSRTGLVPGQPASPTQESRAPQMDRGEAAEAAANNANCFEAGASVVNDNESNSAARSASHVLIKVNVPDTFQVGGAAKPGNVTTDAAVLMCGNRACNHRNDPLDPELAQLNYDLDLSSVGNFPKCAAVDSKNCQYFLRIDTPDRGTGGPQQVTAWLYSGTNPGQAMEVRLNDVVAKQQRYVKASKKIQICLGVSGANGVGNSNGCREINVTRDTREPGGPVPVPVRTQVNGGAVSGPTSGGVVASRGVIGAVGSN